MVDLAYWIERLRNASGQGEILDALWDLRDSAFDHPEAWTVLTAETLFQTLAEAVQEDEDAHRSDGLSVNHLLARALKKLISGP